MRIRRANQLKLKYLAERSAREEAESTAEIQPVVKPGPSGSPSAGTTAGTCTNESTLEDEFLLDEASIVALKCAETSSDETAGTVSPTKEKEQCQKSTDSTETPKRTLRGIHHIPLSQQHLLELTTWPILTPKEDIIRKTDRVNDIRQVEIPIEIRPPDEDPIAIPRSCDCTRPVDINTSNCLNVCGFLPDEVTVSSYHSAGNYYFFVRSGKRIRISLEAYKHSPTLLIPLHKCPTCPPTILRIEEDRVLYVCFDEAPASLWMASCQDREVVCEYVRKANEPLYYSPSPTAGDRYMK